MSSVSFECNTCGEEFDTDKYFKSSQKVGGTIVSSELVATCPVCRNQVRQDGDAPKKRTSTIRNPTPPKAKNGRPSITYQTGYIPQDLKKLLAEEEKLRDEYERERRSREEETQEANLESIAEAGMGGCEPESSKPDAGSAS